MPRDSSHVKGVQAVGVRGGVLMDFSGNFQAPYAGIQGSRLTEAEENRLRTKRTSES